MTNRRSYGQACPVAHALDMLGDRWAMLVIRELRLGGRRYSDLQASLPGIGPGVLSQRLRDLEEVGILSRRKLPSPAAGQVYELTAWGAELDPVFTALASWAIRSPVVPIQGHVSDDAAMLGVRTFFRAGDAGWDARYRIRLRRETYTVVVRGGDLETLVRQEPSGQVDASIETDPDAVRELLTRGVSLDDVVTAGRMTVEGDREAVRRLFAPDPEPTLENIGTAVGAENDHGLSGPPLRKPR